jgi:WD repeat-containing protein 68
MSAIPSSSHGYGGVQTNNVSAAQPKRKEIYRYDAGFTVYCASWSQTPAHRFRLAISSFIEEYSNKVRN